MISPEIKGSQKSIDRMVSNVNHALRSGLGMNDDGSSRWWITHDG